MDTRRLRLTARGTALLGLGSVGLVAGVLLGVPALVQVALLLLVTVGSSIALLFL